jgi:histidyl-tRNA synthetase
VVLDEAPRIGDHLCPACREHFDTVLELVRAAGLEPRLDFRLVRGLDYYTRTTFEFNSDRLGAQSGVGGGGRYDGLVEQIGGAPTPGVGFGSGLERIALAMREQPLPDAAPDVFVVSLTPEARRPAFEVAQTLRTAGLRADLDLAGRSSKGQFKQAGRSGAPVTAVVGAEGLGAGHVRLRAKAGDDVDVPLGALAAAVRERLETEA